MNGITTDQLKAVAEYMGYKVRQSDNPGLTDRVVIWNGKDIHTRWIYNPLTNAEQCLELIEKLMDVFLEVRFRNVDEASVYWCELIHTSDESKDLDIEGKTLPEAVLNAVVSLVRNKV